MSKPIGYSEFVRLFNVEDDKKFFLPGIELRIDGVWVVPPSDINDSLLVPREKAEFLKHPHKDPTIPALKFPCTLDQLDSFLKFYGLDPQESLSPKERARLDNTDNNARLTDASTKGKNTQQLLQEEFRSLVEVKRESFKTYNDVFNHCEMKRILEKQGLSSLKKAQEYLSPVAKEIHPHLCKGGRPKKP